MKRALAVAIAFATTAAQAAETDAERIARLEQRIAILERKLEIRAEAETVAAPTTPVVTASEKGFSLASKESAFVFKLRGLVQADAREYIDDEAVPGANDTFTLRRVRPIFEGTVFGIHDFRFTPDFAGGKTVIQDAYVESRFHPAAKLKVGKFKVPIGLERLQSASDIRFVERPLPTNLVPNRDLGVQLAGDIAGGKLNYALGVFNGVLDGGSSENLSDSDNNGDKDVAARVWAQPFGNADSIALRGLGFGIAATLGDERGSATSALLPAYRTAGQNTFFSYRSGTFADGRRLRWSPQLSWYYGPYGVLAEYVRVAQDVSRNTPLGFRRDTLDHDAWQLAFNWVVTGEEASYGAIKPGAPFQAGTGGIGAWELVARVSELSLDDATFAGTTSFADPSVAARSARAWAVGVNWYLNRNVKVALDYEQTAFDGGAPQGGDRDDEQVLTSRFQLAF